MQAKRHNLLKWLGGSILSNGPHWPHICLMDLVAALVLLFLLFLSAYKYIKAIGQCNHFWSFIVCINQSRENLLTRFLDTGS